MLNNNEFKEYDIKNVWRLRKKLLLISPTGKIYIFNHENFDEQVLMFLNKNHVNLDIVIDKIREEFYQRGFEIEESNLKDIKNLIINFFGFVIYDYDSLTIEYPNENCIYEELTEIQLRILSKLYRKKYKNLFSKEGGDNDATKENSIKNLCYYKRKITKKRFN